MWKVELIKLKMLLQGNKRPQLLLHRIMMPIARHMTWNQLKIRFDWFDKSTLVSAHWKLHVQNSIRNKTAVWS